MRSVRLRRWLPPVAQSCDVIEVGETLSDGHGDIRGANIDASGRNETLAVAAGLSRAFGARAPTAHASGATTATPPHQQYLQTTLRGAWRSLSAGPQAGCGAGIVSRSLPDLASGSALFLPVSEEEGGRKAALKATSVGLKIARSRVKVAKLNVELAKSNAEAAKLNVKAAMSRFARLKLLSEQDVAGRSAVARSAVNCAGTTVTTSANQGCQKSGQSGFPRGLNQTD
ncbi:hypothetical protein FN846DRAFT_1026148 [Sphaerosporella brunnea]|uniref:Uncharacterized protein n=1 Tax=Sphaerosporella brunnea TaxID=1250544 RepID=A0A5J5EBK8_9PEZI|nr:hypothetical protein FN846DRAFT_1026148 [Sphaerosporella brunnea]